MSKLIDDLMKDTCTNQEYGGYWYIAKPYKAFGFKGFIDRAKDAWRVLTDKSRAFHYMEDEVNSEAKND